MVEFKVPSKFVWDKRGIPILEGFLDVICSHCQLEDDCDPECDGNSKAIIEYSKELIKKR